MSKADPKVKIEYQCRDCHEIVRRKETERSPHHCPYCESHEIWKKDDE